MAYPIRPRNLRKEGISEGNVAAFRDLERKITELTEGQTNSGGVGSFTWNNTLGTYEITIPGGSTIPIGTVSSVGFSGGTTGLTVSGANPITSSGTFTLAGTLNLSNGGTGATTPANARVNLGLGTAATTDASAYATAAQGAKADTAVQTITSTDGSVTITGTTAINLAVVKATNASNLLVPVRNATGATLTKGTVVYISGAIGQISTVEKAIATSDSTSAQTLGLIAADLPNNTNGNVVLIGNIVDINTSAYSDGQQLYLSPTVAGGMTATKPYAPSHLVYIAVVEYAHAIHGKLFVKVQNGYELDELHNVAAQSPTNGQTIVYNSTSDLWEKNTVSLTAGVNGTLPAANGGTGQTSFTNGQLLIGNSTGNTLTKATLTAGTNISITNAPGSITINATDQYVGTVTSVAMTTPTGLTVSGSPITTSGTLAIGLQSGYSIPTTASQTNWNTAYGWGNHASAGYLTSETYTGTVTSVSGTGTVNGITLTGTVTSSGSLTLGGTLSGVSLTSQVSGTLPVGSGGTGTATAFTAGSVVFAGASGVYSQNNSQLFWDNTNNRLGIGTNLPSNKVDAFGTSSTTIRSYSTDTASTTYAAVHAGTGAGVNSVMYSYVGAGWYGTTTNHPMLLMSSNTERARINTDGHFLINETSASAASLQHNFEVNGDIMSTGAAAGLFWANRQAAPSSGANWYGWYTASGTIYLYNPAAGNIASINASTGAYTALSDAAKKKDFEPSAVGLDAILALKPTLFRMDTDSADAPKQLGFIAQEVKDYIPQAYVEEQNVDAVGNESLYIGLNDRPIIAALVKAIQDQQSIIDRLNLRVGLLEEK